jgi:hypothetical protein
VADNSRLFIWEINMGNHVAETILSRLGGGRVTAMIGVYNYLSDSSSGLGALTFKWKAKSPTIMSKSLLTVPIFTMLDSVKSGT